MKLYDFGTSGLHQTPAWRLAIRRAMRRHTRRLLAALSVLSLNACTEYYYPASDPVTEDAVMLPRSAETPLTEPSPSYYKSGSRIVLGGFASPDGMVYTQSFYDKKLSTDCGLMDLSRYGCNDVSYCVPFDKLNGKHLSDAINMDSSYAFCPYYAEARRDGIRDGFVSGLGSYNAAEKFCTEFCESIEAEAIAKDWAPVYRIFIEE